jgi:transcriptional regulator with XRE-family HTH domain
MSKERTYVVNAERLRQLREARRWTPSMLATWSNVSSATIKRLEDPTAPRRVARGRILATLAAALDCDIRELAPSYPKKKPKKPAPEVVPTTVRYPRGDERLTPPEQAARRRDLRRMPAEEEAA